MKERPGCVLGGKMLNKVRHHTPADSTATPPIGSLRTALTERKIFFPNNGPSVGALKKRLSRIPCGPVFPSHFPTHSEPTSFFSTPTDGPLFGKKKNFVQ